MGPRGSEQEPYLGKSVASSGITEGTARSFWPDEFEYNICCGRVFNECKCTTQIPLDDVYQYAAEPLDDMYEDPVCINECYWVGSVTCPSYRQWLTKCHEEKKRSDFKIVSVCEDFEPLGGGRLPLEDY